MYKHTVAIVKGNQRRKIIEEALCKIENKIPNIKGRIVIKPNFLSANCLLASTTPETLETVISFFRNKFAENEIYVAEGSHVSEEFVKRYKIEELTKKYQATFFSIDKDEKQWKTIQFEDLSGKKCDVRISNLYCTADYIVSLTVPKTHANIGVSLSMKNFVGTLHPDDRPKFHGLTDNVSQDIKKHYKRQPYDRDDKLGYYLMKLRNILPVAKNVGVNINKGATIVKKNLYNIYKNIQPNLCIIDGFDGMEGNGPWHGNNAHLNTVIIGDNCVATDLIACEIMGQSVKDIGYVNYIKNLDKFKKETEIIGNTIEEVKKQFKPHKFEKYL